MTHTDSNLFERMYLVGMHETVDIITLKYSQYVINAAQMQYRYRQAFGYYTWNSGDIIDE